MITDPLSVYANEKNVNDNDIIFLGCSYTAGVGLTSLKQRYSNLVSNFFNKNEINCAKGGASNYYSFKQFNSLNFKSQNNLVIFQITELARIEYFNPKVQSFESIMLSNTHHKKLPHLLETFDDFYLINDLLSRLTLLINFCREKKLKLVIWSIARIPGNEVLETQLENYLLGFKEYIQLDNRLDTPTSYRVDNAADGTSQLGTGHPGPESNKLIAEKLITHINNLYFQ